MKTKGRNICDTLKAVRKQIADANEIEYLPTECHFKGECRGTCPKCEQEVRDLEQELRHRQKAGKAIKVAGVALGIAALATSMPACSTQKGYNDSAAEIIPIRFQDYAPGDSILLREKEMLSKKGALVVQGHLIDNECKEPIAFAPVEAKLSKKKTATDLDGNFTLEVKQGDVITVYCVGMQERTIKLSEMNLEKINIISLTEGKALLGDVIIIKNDKKDKKDKSSKK